ncbi:Endothelial lipase [Orchesella cincta]|uniref:Endothelial lipase n=1 Tax=Orchesella cincta TaxID=48709 RepID=A0A1D2MR42_ORCCI|nr:Endothelial lipase [Orchesella cincta]
MKIFKLSLFFSSILIDQCYSSSNEDPDQLKSSSDAEIIFGQNPENDWHFSKSRCGRSESVPSAKFYLYSNASNPTDGKVIQYGDMKTLNESSYNKNGPWKVLIHGFLQHKDSFFPKYVKDAYMKRMITHASRNQLYNILVVEWGNKNCSSITDRVSELLSYNTYADCTTNVALQVARMLGFLLNNQVINSTNDIHIIGFSLGAHVAGQAGRNVIDLTGDKIGRITGLDPAGPKSPWWDVFPKHHLDLGPLDSNFVDVIHTSDLLGSERRMGHVDFYVNGGINQPNCVPEPADAIINDFLQICSHNFAVDVFSKSILDNTLKGCACGTRSYWNYLKYLVGWCTCQDQAVVGEFINLKFSAGEYFINTPYEEINWRKYMKSLNESEMKRSDSRVLAILEVLCLV